MGLLYKYKNGNYVVKIYDDGTKIRETMDDEFCPSFAENTDVTISKRCINGCDFCYMGCTPDGDIADLLGWKFLDTLHEGTEMALNLQSPIPEDFVSFLKVLRSKGVIPNVTVNQRDFERHEEFIKSLIDQKLIFGLGVSLVKATPDFVERIKAYPNAVIHVINGIFSPHDVDVLRNNGLKLLILGYKDIGRGENFHSENEVQLLMRQDFLWMELPLLVNVFDVVSFDNLAIEQLDVKRLMSDEEWETFYMGDDGDFTFYIDLVEGTFAKNSLSEEHFPIMDSIDDMFKSIKERKHGKEKEE